MTTGSIWLTYAWKDNNDQEVDFIIQELKRKGLDVGFDRAKLLTGVRLWDQIDRHISDPELDAWAILLTKNSLESEPCQEELAYALDRSLREKGGGFPIIGIFPEPLDRGLIPSAIATRLYVTLNDNQWAEKIVSATENTAPRRSSKNIEPFDFKWHTYKSKPVLEVWPRTGHWSPFWVCVKSAEGDKLGSLVFGPKGVITGTAMVHSMTAKREGYKLAAMSNPVTPTNTAHIFFSNAPSEIIVGGQRDGINEEYLISTTGPHAKM